MFNKAALIAFSLIAMVCGQQVGTLTAETHPSLSWQTCTKSGCNTQSAGTVTLDANWRWVHSTAGATNCYTGNTWDATLCPNANTCAENCAVDGADYAGTYGITTSGDALTLKFVTENSNGKNVGSRVYLMASETEYEMFKLLNQEFTFTVDVSQLPCGLNGALYFSQMDADGGLAKYPTNKAGAKYGTGYCDSQCPRDIKFINGLANSAGWTPDANNANAGVGQYGTCCNEMDVWEANSVSAAFTPHPCTVQGQTRCEGDTACGTTSRYDSVCDPDGCDYNSYRLGDKTFYGPDKTVDTTKPFTVVTQFLTNTGTASGTLSEIRRLYVQDGKVIQNSNVNVPGIPATYDSITTPYCNDEVKAFGDVPDFANKGGLANMSKAMASGMVLVLSLWDDYTVDMLWLDSDYPTTSSASAAGVARGTCATSSGSPPVIETSEANAQVIYSNIKFGAIGTTYSATGTTGGGGGGGGGTTTTSTSPPGATQTHYGQCGGIGYSGPTACASGTTCTYSSTYYSQCL